MVQLALKGLTTVPFIFKYFVRGISFIPDRDAARF